jgi:hypothetical protein
MAVIKTGQVLRVPRPVEPLELLRASAFPQRGTHGTSLYPRSASHKAGGAEVASEVFVQRFTNMRSVGAVGLQRQCGEPAELVCGEIERHLRHVFLHGYTRYHPRIYMSTQCSEQDEKCVGWSSCVSQLTRRRPSLSPFAAVRCGLSLCRTEGRAAGCTLCRFVCMTRHVGPLLCRVQPLFRRIVRDRALSPIGSISWERCFSTHRQRFGERGDSLAGLSDPDRTRSV